ncbi:hypothetical protein B1209_06620 [Raoultella planticola]|uniref:Uncharacterized protein n=1 Tax=Raoultella planticola TaxID=575 RepID=A0A5P6A947_RAOPL|nr:hypothetical protein CRT62_06230 [Raoultella planticola]AUV52550.1 hypothetical protein B1209_06620 [Raoultella planticola]OZP75369.1 hypothetical protein CIG23_00620 [Raoultella planticola]PHH26460.1 hypothetical protein CRX55_21530 [Raoultella planticola]PNK79781.1 hypothetical protein CEP62_017665 [Raoultella planticola]
MFSDLTAIAHPYQFDDFLIAIIFITSMKGVTVLYTVWRFGSRKENKPFTNPYEGGFSACFSLYGLGEKIR